jgi:hypothetical protein
LQESEEFGPTGEESNGANMLGRFVGDLDAMMKDVAEGDIIYIRQASLEEAVERKKVKKPATKAAKPEGTKAKKPAPKKASKKAKGDNNEQ